MTTKILLYGTLAKEYGKEFNFIGINTVIDAIDSLAANFSTFRISVLKNKNYQVFIDDKDIDETELTLNTKEKTIKIVPVLAVASGAQGKVILGVALIGLAFATGGVSIVAGAGLQLGAGLGAAAFKIGVGLLLSGFADLIFTPPKDTPDEESTSYLFSGAVNISKEGAPVPIGYGRVRVGSTNISNNLRNYNASLYGGGCQ